MIHGLLNQADPRVDVSTFLEIQEQKGGGRQGGQEGGQGEGQNGDDESGDNGDSGNSNGGSGKNKKKSPDYVAGWNKALEDYRNGKIKL
jgi:hypothetical protein